MGVSDQAVMWFRASELKHGRVAMLASVGYLLGAAKVTFPGEIAKGVSFASIGANGPYAAWDAVPTEGKLQILGLLSMDEYRRVGLDRGRRTHTHTQSDLRI